VLEPEVMAQGITSFDMLVSLSCLVRKIKEGDHNMEPKSSRLMDRDGKLTNGGKITIVCMVSIGLPMLIWPNLFNEFRVTEILWSRLVGGILVFIGLGLLWGSYSNTRDLSRIKATGKGKCSHCSSAIVKRPDSVVFPEGISDLDKYYHNTAFRCDKCGAILCGECTLTAARIHKKDVPCCLYCKGKLSNA
jgi:hypothetical protein